MQPGPRQLVVRDGDGDRPEPALPDATRAEIRVMVVDASPVFRIGLVSLLRTAGLDVVGDADDAVSAVDVAMRRYPDVILVDGALPGGPGADSISRIVSADRRARVVVLSGAADQPDVVGLLAAGACGCILKSASMHEIVAAVRAAAEGESVISPSLASYLVRGLHVRAPAAAAGTELTTRELEVLRLMARGWDNVRIATALFVSRGTVKHHISSILAKLEVDNRIQAAVAAVRRGLLDAEAPVDSSP